MNNYLSKNIFWRFVIALLAFIFHLSANGQQKNAIDTILFKDSIIQLEPGSMLQLSKTRINTIFTKVNGDVLAQSSVPNITNTLYGRLNGLMVTQNGGQPGYDQATMAVRGRATYDNATLACYVDGFQVDISFYFQYLSAGEIASIALLKDPVSLATLGMKGANGVLWVTTKRGKSEKLRVDAQVVSGIQQAVKIQKPYDSYNYASLYNQAISNDNYNLNNRQYVWTPTYSDAQLQAYKDGTGINVDWIGQALKKSGYYTDANVNIQGGTSGIAKYNLYLDYMGQSGLFNVPSSATLGSNSDLKRYTIRSNVDLKFFKIFEAKIDLGGRIESYRQPMSSNTFDNASAFWTRLTTYPNNIYPVKDNTTGNWSGNTLYAYNPIAELNAKGVYLSHDRTLQGNFSLKEDLDFITKGLYLNQSASFNTWTRVIQNKTATYARYFNGTQATSDRTTPLTFGANTPYGQLTWKQANLVAGYDRTFDDHSIVAAFNYYVSDMTPDANEDATKINYHYQNIAGRVNYSYKQKYIADFGFGYSGSDAYAPGSRWQFYPAISLGWLVSSEAFMQTIPWITYLKVYAGAGKSGNDQTSQGRYLYQQYYRYTTGSITGNNSLNYNNGISLGRLATPNITAEHSNKYELGFDLAIFKKMTLNTTLFIDKRNGVITKNNLIPGSIGYTGADMLPYQNIGKVTNKGIEFALGYKDNKGAFQYAIDLMGTYANNKINYQAEILNKNNFSNSTGLPIGTPIGLVADGLYQMDDFDANGNLKSGIPTPSFGPVQPGDIKYKDLDNNGYVDNTDFTKIGNPSYPKFYYGINLSLRFKGFDFSALLQGVTGMSVNLLSAAYNQTVPFVGNTTIYPIAGHAWAYYPSEGIDTRNEATFPRLTTVANSNNYTNSTYWMKNADFLKVRSLQLGYSLPKSVSQSMHLEAFRFFLTALNPITWSSFYRKYNLDPEAPSGYPALKSFNAGIKLTL